MAELSAYKHNQNSFQSSDLYDAKMSTYGHIQKRFQT